MKKKPAPVEKAYSSNHAIDGLELKPWTPSREVAAQSLGLLYPHIGAEGVARYRKTRVYPGALRDTIIVLWLCSIDDAAVREAERDPETAIATADKWAAGLGFTRVKSDAFWTAYGKFMDIVTQVEAATSVPVPSEDESESDPDPNV